MGEWTAVVTGHGIHDNKRDDDADALLADFVGKLRSAGHVIYSASLTVGATRSIGSEDREEVTK